MVQSAICFFCFLLLIRNSEWNYQNNGHHKIQLNSIDMFCILLNQNFNCLWQENIKRSQNERKNPKISGQRYKMLLKTGFSLPNKINGSIFKMPPFKIVSDKRWWKCMPSHSLFLSLLSLCLFHWINSISYFYYLSDLVVAFWFYANLRLNQDHFLF